jgi:hypothetical protein
VLSSNRHKQYGTSTTHVFVYYDVLSSDAKINGNGSAIDVECDASELSRSLVGVTASSLPPPTSRPSRSSVLGTHRDAQIEGRGGA